jgi:pilus assembly protein CpaB
MNSRRFIAALCFALSCSGLLTWQLSRHLARGASPARAVPLRRVIVAARNIAAGEALDSSSLTTISLPASQSLAGFFSKPQDLAGRVLLVSISSGEPVMSHDLLNAAEKDSLAATIPDGMRAVTIPAANQSEGSSSLATPGSHVDILVSYRSETEARFVSSMVLQDVPVLASAPTGTPDAHTKLPSAGIVDLLVTPEDAARLTVASSLGKLTFALRNRTDKAVSLGLSHVTLSPFQNQSEKRPVAATSVHQSASPEEKPKGFTVETLSGGKSSVQTFPEGQQ